jgi:predicted GIY-YIG superfamily endonuclease
MAGIVASRVKIDGAVYIKFTENYPAPPSVLIMFSSSALARWFHASRGRGTLYRNNCYKVSCSGALKLVSDYGIETPEIRWKQQNFSMSDLSDAEIAESAKRYETRSAWASSEYRCYTAARKRGQEFYDSCVAHMKPIETSIYQFYGYKFDDAVYVGITRNPARRHAVHTKVGPVFDYAKSSGKVAVFYEIAVGLTREIASGIEKAAISHIKTTSLKLLNKTRGGEIGTWKHKALRIDYAGVLLIAKKYETRRHFQRGRWNIYRHAKLKEWLPRLTVDAGWKTPPPALSYSECADYARSHPEWSARPYSRAYRVAIANKWIRQIKLDLGIKHRVRAKTPPATSGLPYRLGIIVVNVSEVRGFPLLNIHFTSIEKLLEFKQLVGGGRHFTKHTPMYVVVGRGAKKAAEIIGFDVDWSEKNKRQCEISDDEIVADALKYATRTEWSDKSRKCRVEVMNNRRHLIERCTSHMVRPPRG